MISLEAYRACIGTFQQKLVISCTKTFSRSDEDSNSHAIFENICSNFSIFLGVLILINMSFLEISLLIQHGDIETNPGPAYTIMKSVTASYHQGDTTIFGDTAGRQCLCNSIYAIAWSLFKNVGLWNDKNLNHILVKGDQLYKAKNTVSFLSTEDLPSSVKVNEAEINIVKLYNYHSRLCFFETFISKMHKNEENNGNGLILIFNGFSVCVVWNKAHFFLFDPHSRNSNDLVCENGTAVLLKFGSLLAIEKYILEVYVNIGDTMLIDLQYVKLVCHDEIDFQCIYSIENVRAKKRKYMAATYNVFKTSEKYAKKLERNKQYKTENYKNILEKICCTRLIIINVFLKKTCSTKLKIAD